MTAKILIYGATGYTGRLVCEQARQVGLAFEIAGRNQARLTLLADHLRVPFRAFAVEDLPRLPAALEGVTAVLNCAGPFAATAQSMMQACIEAGVHYLDITAEFNVYALAEAWSERAAAAGVMLLPGVGWDVVPSDCLAAHAASKLIQPQRVRLALEVAGSMSRGSAMSAGEIIGVGLLVRSNGTLITAPNPEPATFDFGEGEVVCARLSFGDLVTAWASTRIPNIETFVHIKGDAFPAGDLALLPEGPSLEERQAHGAKVVAEVTGADGTIARSRLETVNGYSYTPLAAVEAARRILAGESRPGFQTPVTLFGPSFALSIPGTRLVDLP